MIVWRWAIYEYDKLKLNKNKTKGYAYSWNTDLVSSTTSTSWCGCVMGVLLWPAVGSSAPSSPFVELTTCATNILLLKLYARLECICITIENIQLALTFDLVWILTRKRSSVTGLLILLPCKGEICPQDTPAEGQAKKFFTCLDIISDNFVYKNIYTHAYNPCVVRVLTIILLWTWLRKRIRIV